MADNYHFLQLTLENIRAFGVKQMLDLRGSNGRRSRWCVILGSNGVGKTTIMQALAVMKPVPAFERDAEGKVVGLGQHEGGEAPEPDWIEPDLIEYQNTQIISFMRRGEEHVTSVMMAKLVNDDNHEAELGFRSVMARGYLQSADPIAQRVKLDGNGPIVIAYGAARHSGSRNMSGFAETKPTASLFDELIELLDPEEVIEQLHYIVLSSKAEDRKEDELRASKLLDLLRAAMSAVIPDGQVESISLGGSRHATDPALRSVLRFKTPSGDVAFPEMSLGYRTMVSWIIDLGYRLSLLRPDSENPLAESAIVLIDEVDLHLHPTWQRELSGHLLTHFPNVQFIVTTHSPIVAQEAIAKGQPVAVVRWEGEKASILNNPLPRGIVSYDEVVASEAFDLETALDTQTEDALRKR
ncbi:AAA family ATPase [Acetobacter syzygii]|uniref:AAA family ATPase n=1 Tax=Acetobacter syzygii TaxID=146476 RepID=UPI0039E8A62E